MDALELQAALVKLDPATTVTPIGSNVKVMPPHHRITFAVDLDQNDLTLENTGMQNDGKPMNNTAHQTNNGSRKLHNCSNQLTVPGHQNHPSNQQIEMSKCEMAEVR
ncbi:uncharacterized protein LOC108625049 [Ceratina calcarata]|uniref:Uncharacterized protein LOC108625049 n=1 Tax=Ceratina calcarata TaxID=156304 RepID=A0AAJ7S0S3_9HYME|nr:uncharacterized protein LOC108625049 [Ceratina calcarata]XP_026669326.1 uncharacterized protein LOC108625049 [Ceratina calcarata]XP_026669330.1 uncharacterized protein LOC108625049 [Ceratina calcarata]